MRVATCADDADTSVSYVRAQVRKGKLKAYRLGGMLLIATSDWDDFLDREAKPINNTRKIAAVSSA